MPITIIPTQVPFRDLKHHHQQPRPNTPRELGYRKPLRQLRSEKDPHDLVAARRLLSGLHIPFGRQYRDMVRKFVDCDFAVGSADTQNPEVQTAIYNDVVRLLDGMIKDFEQLVL